MSGEVVAVALSGGVDSSVAAAVLLDRGFRVIGMTMRVAPCDTSQQSTQCDPPRWVEDAARVAQALDIPHHIFDLGEPFARHVIDPFCEEYARGRTPNPCVRCNAFIKFGELLGRARELGADRLATGHYARTRHDERSRRWLLLAGVDNAKDQSYSLYALSQEQLARSLFPLGQMTKSQVRRMAAEAGLPTAARPESQEICFLAGQGYREYLQQRRPELAAPGPIVDREGRQLGRHRGIACYTIGQRHGLGVASGEPLYVIAIDAAENRLIVGGDDELMSRALRMREVNYVSLPELPPGGTTVDAKVRSGAPLAEARAQPDGDGVRLDFAQPQRAVAAGQAAVCYRGEAVVAGGTIDSAF